MNTSSSLAFALGDPSSARQPSVCQPERSAEFFDAFIAEKSREINVSSYNSNGIQVSPKQSAERVSQESPDPLALKPAAPGLSTPVQTPRKRKPIVEIESPSAKRIQSSHLGSRTPQHARQMTPAKQSLKKTATLAYVEIPPKPWLSPSSSRKLSISSPRLFSKENLGKPADEQHDLSGYGSDYSPYKVTDTTKSSARRTGDRDERGAFREK